MIGSIMGGANSSPRKLGSLHSPIQPSQGCCGWGDIEVFQVCASRGGLMADGGRGRRALRGKGEKKKEKTRAVQGM